MRQILSKARSKSYDDSFAESLTDPAEAAAYIDAVMELDDPAALLLALRQVAKAHGIAEGCTTCQRARQNAVRGIE
jgi:DNA-binding phage protein